MGIVNDGYDHEQARALELASAMDDVLRIQGELIRTQQKLIDHLQGELDIYRDMANIP
jgi:hypothetical protein